MTPTCLTCKAAALRDANDVERNTRMLKLSAGGTINCTRSPHAASFHDITHTCTQYTPAIEAIVASRLAWAKQRGFAVNETTKGTA